MISKNKGVLIAIVITFIVIQGIALLFKLFPYDITEVSFMFLEKKYVILSNHPFPFYRSFEITPNWWSWILFNKINEAILYYIIYCLAVYIEKRAMYFIAPFVVFKISIVVEYVLSYNQPWFTLYIPTFRLPSFPPYYGHLIIGTDMSLGLTHFLIIFEVIILYLLWQQNRQ